MRDAVTARHLDGAEHEHLRARGGHLEHLLVGDLGQHASGRDDARVGCEDAGDVGVDLARRAERGGEGDSGRIGPASPERRHVHRVAREALEARDEHDAPAVESLDHADRRDLADLGLRVDGVGQDARLRAGEGHGFVPEVVHGHRDERARDALPRGEQHVELAGMRLRRDLAGELEQRVGRVAHRRDRCDDPHATLARLDQAPRDMADLVGVGHRRAAELHDDRLGRRLGRRVHGGDCGWLVGLSLPRAAEGHAHRARLRRAVARPRALARRAADALRSHGARLVRSPDLGDPADHRARVVLHDVLEDARRPRGVRLPQPRRTTPTRAASSR